MRSDAAIASVFALGAYLAAQCASAQQTDEAPAGKTAEEMIAVERELYRPPGVYRPCPEPKPGEIVVCHTDDEEFEDQVESSLEEAQRKGEPVRDGLPRAPDVFGLPPCSSYTFCSRIGRAPRAPLLIDLSALPHALTPEEAAHVFRAEVVPTSQPEPQTTASLEEAAPD